MDPKDQLIQALTLALSKQKTTPFYNEPIFLTLLSIILGGIAITLITKHIVWGKGSGLILTFLFTPFSHLH